MVKVTTQVPQFMTIPVWGSKYGHLGHKFIVDAGFNANHTLGYTTFSPLKFLLQLLYSLPMFFFDLGVA